MTVITRTITLITIEDGANFDFRMDRRAFDDQDDASLWASIRVQSLQAQRREEGETDELFIEAIRARTEYITLEVGDDQ